VIVLLHSTVNDHVHHVVHSTALLHITLLTICVHMYVLLYCFVQGFDNLYVLTGGLQAFCELHPNYIEGTLPEPKVQLRGSSSSSSTRGTPQRRSSTGSTTAGSVRGRCVLLHFVHCIVSHFHIHSQASCTSVVATAAEACKPSCYSTCSR
jgi:hypothetical protein